MSGGALRPWEKLYWGVFVAGLAVLLFNRLREAPKPPPDPAIAAAKEAAKAERARMVLSGGSVIEGEEDPFDGLAPEVSSGLLEEREPRIGHCLELGCRLEAWAHGSVLDDGR